MTNMRATSWSLRPRIPTGAANFVAAFGLALLAALTTAQPSAAESSLWDDYLDFAYVYSSADEASLAARVEQYGKEAQMPLADYIRRSKEDLDATGGEDEAQTRRRAIAYLLQYLSTGEPKTLEKAVDTIEVFARVKNGRHENQYWYHYINAHRALEKGSSADFVRHVLGLWMDVIVPLESPFETLQSLSLSQSANSGFVSALPYAFENVARLILLRSQEMGMTSGLDPLAAVIRLLADGRVGANPDVVPPEASSRAYLERIINRLEGGESDGGSLSFTLALFEAGRPHDRARSLMASEGLSEDALQAIGVTSSAYATALDLAQTVQGQAAVYMRVLRQMGEVYAAKQRLGVDPYVELPFTIEGAMSVYAALHEARKDGQWRELGFRGASEDAYFETMKGLWSEIQEASLNSADYYLSRATESRARAGDLVRNATRLYARYLSFFQTYTTEDSVDWVPDAAYFAAYEAAKGYGDAFLAFTLTNASQAEVVEASSNYELALRIYPFDRRLWPQMTAALERRGRANDFLSTARGLAENVAGSRHVTAWIEKQEPGYDVVDVMRRGLSDELVLMYMGFADSRGIDELEQKLAELRERRAQLERKVDGLVRARETGAGVSSPPAAPAMDDGGGGGAPMNSQALAREIEMGSRMLAKLDDQIQARSRALPIFRQVLEVRDLAPELRSQRDHGMHTLLRRMYHEK